jgi:DNA-binding transcriptional LysR family regulator
MDTRLWELFVLLAEHRHFGRAASAGGLTQPALSQHIGQLERATGCQLFVRTSRSVELSKAGALLLPRVRRLLRDVRALSNAGARHQRRSERRLLLGVPAHFGAVAAGEVAHRLEAAHRDTWTFETARLGAGELADALSEGEIDLALMHLPVAVPDLATSPPVVVEPRGVVLPAGHRLGTRPTLRSGDLADERLLHLDQVAFGPAGSPWPHAAVEVGLPPVTCVEELLDAVVLGHGVCVAPMSDAARLRAHGLTQVPLLDVDSVALAFAWHQVSGSPIAEAELPLAAGWFAHAVGERPRETAWAAPADAVAG